MVLKKRGFKQTEVGVIPEDWNIELLGNLGFDISDGNYSSKYPKQSEFTNIGIPFIRANNIKNMRIDDEGMRFISSEQHSVLLKGHLKEGDILITTRGELGNVAIVPKNHVNSNINAQIVRINTGNSVDNWYFAFFLTFDTIQRTIKGAETGSALKQLPVGKLVQLPVILPPFPEQRAIAAALSDVDALLASLEALITKKRLIQQGSMQELLTGKCRLPGFSGEWKVKKIGDVAHSTAGGTPSTSVPSFWGGSIRWMSSGELHLKHVYEVAGRITEEGLKNSSTKIIPQNSVLIGLAGQGKTRGTVAINMVELCTNQSIAAIYPSDTFVPLYLYYNLDSRYEELRDLSSGDGGRGGLNLKIINSLFVPFPSIEEQQAIVDVLSDIDADINALEQQRDKTHLLKQGMMQELLTGRTRLI